MLIVLLVLFVILSFAMSVWALVIIFKRSVIGGLLTLFLGLPMLYYLVTGWGKEGEDIKKPFFLSIVFYFMAIAVGVKYFMNFAQEEKLIEMPSPPARSTPSVRETPRSVESSAPRTREPAPAAAETVRVTNTPPAQPAVAQPVAPQPAAAPRAPVQRVEVVKEAPRRPAPAQSNCVYKPVMTDEDLAKCR